MLISWNIQDPTTQLTSSINHLIKDTKDWYGKFLLILLIKNIYINIFN